MKAHLSPFTACGTLVAPPSKSHAHRLLFAAALSDKKTKIENVGVSDDVAATVRCLTELGADIRREGNDVSVVGIFAQGDPPQKDLCLFPCGESGTTLRFLLPVAAALGKCARFTGRGKLLQRPNDVLFRLLKDHGVPVGKFETDGQLRGGVFDVDATVSSQYVSGLLFALPLLPEDSKIVLHGNAVSADYIQMTLETLRPAGVRFSARGNEIFVEKQQRFRLPDNVRCEGDWSAAAYPLALGALCGKVCVKGLSLSSRQADRAIVSVLRRAGCKILCNDDGVTAGKSPLNAFTDDVEDHPDLAPVLAALAAHASGVSVLESVHRLKDKESDRLEAVCRLLTVAGIPWHAENDRLKIFGGHVRGGTFDGFSDHRIVMSACVLAAAATGPSVITTAEAVTKSYPDFWREIQKTGGNDVRLER